MIANLPPTNNNNNINMSPMKIRSHITRLYAEYDRGSITYRVFGNRLSQLINAPLPDTVSDLIKSKRPDFSLTQLLSCLNDYISNKKNKSSAMLDFSQIDDSTADHGMNLTRRKRNERSLKFQDSLGIKSVLGDNSSYADTDETVETPESTELYNVSWDRNRIQRSPEKYEKIYGSKHANTLAYPNSKDDSQYDLVKNNKSMNKQFTGYNAYIYGTDRQRPQTARVGHRHQSNNEDEASPLNRLLDELLLRYSKRPQLNPSSVCIQADLHIPKNSDEYYIINQSDWLAMQQCFQQKIPIHIKHGDMVREIFQLYNSDLNAGFVFNEANILTCIKYK